MYCSRYHGSTSLLFWWSIGYAVADNHGVAFLYPTEDLTFNYLDTINVTYTSPFPKPELWIFCTNYTDPTSGLIKISQQDVQAYNGTVAVKWKWLGGSPCWFDIKPDSTGGLGANSENFIIDQNKRSIATTMGLDFPTTTSTASATSTPTPSSDASDDVTTTSTSTSTTSTSTPTASSDARTNGTTSTASSSQDKPPTGLSSEAKAGIGIGIGLVALIALAGAFFLWRRKQARDTDYMVYGHGADEKIPGASNAPPPHADYSELYPNETVAYEMDAPQLHHEMPATRTVGELSGAGHSGHSKAQVNTLG